MDISQRTTAPYVTGDRRWRTADAAPRKNNSGTLDLSLFTEADHFPDGYLPGGIVLSAVAGSPDVYGPTLPTGAGGRTAAVGFLWADVPLSEELIAAGTGLLGCAVMVEGKVDENYLPIAPATAGGLEAEGKTDLADHFRFIDSQP